MRLSASGDGALAFSIVDAPDHGTLGELSAEGVATYTPGANYHGEDAFTFRATDRHGQSAQATVNPHARERRPHPFAGGGPAHPRVYYSTRGNSLYVANLDGSNITPLVTNQTTVHGIALDVTAGRLYWADWLGQKILSTRLADGSDIQTVNEGSSRNLGLAWMPAP